MPLPLPCFARYGSAVLLWFIALAFAALPTEPELFAAVLARIDLDHDGVLSRDEYLRVDGSTNFDAMDADRDGLVVTAELAAWVRVTQPRPMDRPVSRTGDAPPPGLPPPTGSFAPVATSARTPAGAVEAAVPEPASASPLKTEGRTLFRAAVFGGMLAAAGVAAWFMLRSGRDVSPRRRRR